MGKHSKQNVTPPAGAPMRRRGGRLVRLLLAAGGVTLLAAILLLFRRAVPAPQGAGEPNAAPRAEVEVVDTEREEPSGWVEEADGTVRYYDPTTHEMRTGWLDDEGRRYYLDESTGALHTGWLELDGRRYWMDDGTRARRGELLTAQWLDEAGERYYLSDDGAVLTDWQEVEGTRCLFAADGRLQRGLVSDSSGTQYWIDPETGELASHEWVEIDGINYAFDDDGSLVTLGDVVPPGDEENRAQMSARQRAVVDACAQTPWPGKALCAAWVSSVFVNAGEPAVPGDACDVCRQWCHSSDLAELKPGMIIAVTSHPRTDNGRIWGHICIYVGDGLICDSGTYGIRTSSLGSWLAWFGASEQPQWGWANGIDLSAG